MTDSIQAFRKPALPQNSAAIDETPQVSVGRPDAQQFYRSIRDEALFDAAILTLNSTKEVYLVYPSLEDQLSHEVQHKTLAPFIDREGNIVLWPITGTPCSWRDSALKAADQACDQWVRIITHREQEMYQTMPAVGGLEDPQWPQDVTLDSLVEQAFEGRLISDLGHPVLKTLRGEV